MDQELKPIEDIKPVEIMPQDEPVQSLEEPDISGELQSAADMSDDGVVQSIEKEDPTNEKKSENIVPEQKKAKKDLVKIILIIVIIMLLGAGVVAYWWRDKTANDEVKTQTASIAALNKKVKDLEIKVEQTSELSAAPVCTACTPVAPSTAVIDSIKSSIASGNTAALEGYMANSVNRVMAASENIGAGTPAQAVVTITDFISSATSPWNFDILPTILDQYSEGVYGAYFSDIAIVGSSKDGKVISFSFNCDGKVSAIFMASNQSVLE